MEDHNEKTGMKIKRLKAQFWKWIYLNLSDWAMKAEWNCTDSDLCPYGAQCEICTRCGRCTCHGEACAGMSDEELAESRAYEKARMP